tara:strand:- start:71 stop:400 length:330 start_codon:yes stop_codon:yes gene_type:complete
MKKFSSNIFLVFAVSIIFFLSSCQSVKDGLSGRKSENSDEFLVQKKNPLVLPPDYMKLPKPKAESKDSSKIIEEETDIKKLLQAENEGKNKNIPGTSKNIEEFVIKNIK